MGDTSCTMTENLLLVSRCFSVNVQSLGGVKPKSKNKSCCVHHLAWGSILAVWRGSRVPSVLVLCVCRVVAWKQGIGSGQLDQVLFGAGESRTPCVGKQRTEQALEPPVPAVLPWLEGTWLYSSGSVRALTMPFALLWLGAPRPALARLSPALQLLCSAGAFAAEPAQGMQAECAVFWGMAQYLFSSCTWCTIREHRLGMMLLGNFPFLKGKWNKEFLKVEGIIPHSVTQVFLCLLVF